MVKKFRLYFNDLSWEKQQEFITDLKEMKLEEFKTEAEDEEGKHINENYTWQEAYCRLTALEYELWENEKDPKQVDWEYIVENYAEEEAQDLINTTFFAEGEVGE